MLIFIGSCTHLKPVIIKNKSLSVGYGQSYFNALALGEGTNTLTI